MYLIRGGRLMARRWSRRDVVSPGWSRHGSQVELKRSIWSAPAVVWLAGGAEEMYLVRAGHLMVRGEAEELYLVSAGRLMARR